MNQEQILEEIYGDNELITINGNVFQQILRDKINAERNAEMYKQKYYACSGSLEDSRNTIRSMQAVSYRHIDYKA